MQHEVGQSSVSWGLLSCYATSRDMATNHNTDDGADSKPTEPDVPAETQSASTSLGVTITTESTAVAVDSASLAPAPAAGAQHQGPVPGRRMGRYHIVGEHGRGALGRVSRAHDSDLGRDIAIKELISIGRISEMRFLREVMITARLQHPGIVPLYEAGRWPDGTPWYAMKLVAGRSLRELIAERTTIDNRIDLLHHVIAVADAIAYAHGRNIIHRDLKPGNV